MKKLRHASKTPEFAHVRPKLAGKPLGNAILWMLDGEKLSLDAAIASLEMDAGSGSWSERGQDLALLAALFDWL